MKLKELMEIADIDNLLVIHTDKDGHEKHRELIVLLSHFDKYSNGEVKRVVTTLETSNPNINGSIQVSPCLQAWVLIGEE